MTANLYAKNNIWSVNILTMEFFIVGIMYFYDIKSIKAANVLFVTKI